MKTCDYIQHFESLAHIPLPLEQFCNLIHGYFPEYRELSYECFFEILLALHAPLTREIFRQDSTDLEYVGLNTKSVDLSKGRFCFVDIETTSANIEHGQVIEIGAIIAQDGKICDIFETLIHSPFVPDEITQLTGINAQMLENATNIDKALRDFRAFLSDCVFVAHNVTFDYYFLSDSMLYYSIPPLFNPRLCTVELSRRVIPSKKHALSYLNTALGINTLISHRALADAFTAMQVYNICMLSLPNHVATVQDLIDFSKGRIDYSTRATSKRNLHKSTTKYFLE
ncbi:3'-5' exonuclease [Helicobacter aurati]|uniref:3'-5' exonuclease n=1 Tax=Helicobacter aurati TaxID=137778 RepID=A0A3D8J9A2_9HELI|nr:3'-5' exonuclease [Helicobacter aurati]RDU73431.1 3'-5' exonuclease [Helicobacter aurati]